MNVVEKTANLAIKYCAHILIYIYDLTEPYPLKDQQKLLKNLKEFDKPVIVYIMKSDILKKDFVENFLKKNKDITNFYIVKDLS